MYRSALLHGVAAAVEHERIPLRQGFRAVVDVGAGRGQFALVARRRFPNATLHCFEPLPAARQKLAAVAGGFAGTRIYDLALGAGRASGELHVSADLDSSSLLQMTATQATAFPGTEETERVTVSLARLDTILGSSELRSPSLLKIDVQGYELEVLQGAEGVLESFAAILVECSFAELYAGQALADDIVGYLGQRGFRLTGVFSPTYDRVGRCLQADFLFEPSGSGEAPSFL